NETNVTSSFFYSVTNHLDLHTNGTGTVTAPIGLDLELTKNYTITAVPGVGQVFSNWTGSVTSSLAKLTFTMQSNTVLYANFITNPFIAAAGAYNGLFHE